MSIDTVKNRVYMTVRGFFTKPVMEECFEDWKKALDLLKPNFTILSDSRLMQPHEMDLQELHTQIQHYVNQRGLAQVAVVKSISDLTSLQTYRISQKTQIRRNVFSSIEEATLFLDNFLMDNPPTT